MRRGWGLDQGRAMPGERFKVAGRRKKRTKQGGKMSRIAARTIAKAASRKGTKAGSTKA